MFVVFLLHHDVTVGLGVGPEVSMGPLSADMQPPPPSADSAWFLTQNSGFGDTTDGRNRAPPRPLFFEQKTATELGFRFPFICSFKSPLASALGAAEVMNRTG